MAILIGLVLALVVLWAWLAGHWFGRVLAFLAMVAILFFGVAIANGQQNEHNLAWLAALSVGAWFVSGFPTYLKGPTVSYRGEPQSPQAGSAQRLIEPHQD